jgi:uncharacterized membrane protein YqgA involved in biofilm formation
VFIGIGTVINVIAILLGTVTGKIAGKRFTERTRNLLTDILGIVTLISAASALISLWDTEFVSVLPNGGPILVILAALILGGLLGSFLNLEMRLEHLGSSLKRRFDTGESSFVEGFVTASLIFVIGPLAILGSISDGMSAGVEQLLLKSTLDFFASIAFAAALGWGVAFSALPVALYQGLWTLVGLALGSVLLDYQVVAMTATGGVLLIGIGLKLLRIKDIAIGNLLPALALAPIIAAITVNL